MEKKLISGRFPILVYHQIAEETDLNFFATAKKTFLGQMRYLHEHYQTMRLNDLLQLIREYKPIPQNAIAVTFDDGYADTFSEAFPILQKYKIPATVYITTGYIAGAQAGLRKAKMLSWKMIQKMQKSKLIEFGAHTVTHPNLNSLSIQKAKWEIVESKKRLEEKLQTPVKTFAYPYGNAHSFNKRIQKVVEDSGYWGACTVLPGENDSKTNPFALRRISFGKSQIRYFALQLSEFSNGTLPKREISEFHGINKKVIGLWKKRYQWLGRRFKRDGFLIWPSRNPKIRI